MDELRRLTARAENRRTETGIPRVAMVKGKIPEHQLTGIYEPMVNLILQGGKTLTIGDRTLHFDPASYFVMSIDVPATGTVHQGGHGQPYLAVALTLDPEKIASLLDDIPTCPDVTHTERGFSVCPVTPELLDAWVRLLRLMERPADIAALAPAYEREIMYRVLQGSQGWMLRDIAAQDSTLARVRQAIAWLRNHYAQSVQVETLADVAAMSPATFHRRFKAVTAMSPIQFQKQLRLLRARELLVVSAQQASTVAYEVGYESPSQFSREYTRFFGMSPAKDALEVRKQLRPDGSGGSHLEPLA
ncbi:AraC family transcriptional regulator N-terminal domain-containing protein [Dyella sp. Tek66A03]|uniref:AraC family transcriptional regulator N-terminal domain-containing protein n=1 Tax=Dyella sp. Tek66A03 TaxID=3458298 RepID=UPI00403EC8CB